MSAVSRLKSIGSFLFFTLLLTACGGGGGGDSSSGGGTSSIYAGTYAGAFKVTAVGPGGTVTENLPGSVIVAANGSLSISTAGAGSGGTNCSAVPPTFLSGNTFSYSTNYTCTYPDLGACKVQDTGSGSINGSTLTMSANGTVTCNAGKLTVTVRFSGTKQAAAAAVVHVEQQIGQSSRIGLGIYR